MEPIIIEVRLAPDTAALLKNFVPSQPVSGQLPTHSLAEQAARMRMQPPSAPKSLQSSATYVPPQYQPQPSPAHVENVASAAPHTQPTATSGYAAPASQQMSSNFPVRNSQPTAPVNPTLPIAAPAKPASTAGQSTAQPAAVPSKPVPVADAPTYELDQLARATATLADAGKMQQIQQLFQQFGIQQLTTLPKDRYGEYATALRQMGVRI
jgi:hypothetical protein